MATLVFSAIGTVIGGPIGGAIGALVGSQVDRVILGGGGGNREGARLKELAITTSSYGSAIPRVFGQMRLPGTIVWATDLVEHKDKQGGGKGKPSVTSYSYTVSFAVLLSSRPLASIGRIWADGNLLRGAAGDLKVGGQMRFYPGTGGQSPDPLLVAAIGLAACPAYRGCAYVVFEDLQLAEFGNRIPALSFELSTGETELTFSSLLEGLVDDYSADAPLSGVSGLSCEGSLAETLSQLDAAFPLDCDVSGNTLTISREAALSSINLREPAVAVADDAFGSQQGFTRKRFPPPAAQPGALRYYDVERDYQPGLQRASGRPRPGQISSIDLPAAMAASDARALVSDMSRRANWSRQTLAWRTAELDPTVTPGALVTVPGESGLWRVNDWEWRDRGVELMLARAMSPVIEPGAINGDSGLFNNPLDAVGEPTVVAAFELPWSGSESDSLPLLFAAASSGSPGWTGAALFADHGDGQLQPLGSSGRSRAGIGQLLGTLAPASPHLIDRTSTFDIQMVARDLGLTSCTLSQLANGSNRALIGEELIQFRDATPLGEGKWRLSTLLRGRGGTEHAISSHSVGERFVMLDGTSTVLDSVSVGELPQTQIAALGLTDIIPATSPIVCRGITRRPLSPVHPRVEILNDGGIKFGWTRRARGAWIWLDASETPLNEQEETYEVSFGPSDNPIMAWATTIPSLLLDPAQVAALQASSSGQPFHVRQQGTYARSLPLFLTNLI